MACLDIALANSYIGEDQRQSTNAALDRINSMLFGLRRSVLEADPVESDDR
jgi:hypothetical protein